jgi:hypothetical protein
VANEGHTVQERPIKFRAQDLLSDGNNNSDHRIVTATTTSETPTSGHIVHPIHSAEHQYASDKAAHSSNTKCQLAASIISPTHAAKSAAMCPMEINKLAIAAFTVAMRMSTCGALQRLGLHLNASITRMQSQLRLTIRV